MILTLLSVCQIPNKNIISATRREKLRFLWTKIRSSPFPKQLKANNESAKQIIDNVHPAYVINVRTIPCSNSN